MNYRTLFKKLILTMLTASIIFAIFPCIDSFAADPLLKSLQASERKLDMSKGNIESNLVLKTRNIEDGTAVVWTISGKGKDLVQLKETETTVASGKTENSLYLISTVAKRSKIRVTVSCGSKIKRITIILNRDSGVGVHAVPTKLECGTGKTAQISVRTYPGEAALTYRSNKENIAAVNEYGTVTGISAGTAIITITADSNGKKATDTVKVTVVKSKLSIEAFPENVSLKEGGSLQADIVMDQADADVSYSSSDEKVAAVSAAGLITGVAEGTATITVTAVKGRETAEDSILVTVAAEELALEIIPAEVTLEEGMTRQLAIGTTPAGLRVDYSSNNASIVSVSSNGLITAISEGTAEITVTAAKGDRTVTDTVVTTVTKKIRKITALAGAGTIYTTVGTYPALPSGVSAALSDGTSRYLPVAWNSVNVTTPGARTAQGTLVLPSGIVNPDGFMPTAIVIVQPVIPPAVNIPVTGITVTGAGGAAAITTYGGILQMNAVVSPANATNKNIIWTVSPGGIASIGNTGLLTALGNGVVTVKASSVGTPTVSGTLNIAISNQVALSGAPVFAAGTPATYNTQLTAGAGTLSPASNLTYNWYRSDDAVFSAADDTFLGSASAYTPAADDVGKYLILAATSSDASGTAYTATDVVVTRMPGPTAPLGITGTYTTTTAIDLATHIASSTLFEAAVAIDGISYTSYAAITTDISGDLTITGLAGVTTATTVRVRAKETSTVLPGEAAEISITGVVTAVSDGITSAAGKSTVYLGQPVSGLAAGDILVKKGTDTLIQNTDYTLSADLSGTRFVITFLPAAAIGTASAITAEISKDKYVINGGSPLTIANGIHPMLPVGASINYTVPSGTADATTATVKGGFGMGQTEVTYELWYAVRVWGEANGYVFVNKGQEGSGGSEGAPPTAGNCYKPVTCVLWPDIIVWLNALSEREGVSPVYRTLAGVIFKNSNSVANVIQTDNSGYRLPTGNEWEMAARWIGAVDPNTAGEYGYGTALATERKTTVTGGTTYYWTPGGYASGAVGNNSDAAATGAAAWYAANASGEAQPAGGRNANALGLYDMSGNVCEWCFNAPTAGSGARYLLGGYMASLADGVVTGRKDYASIGNTAAYYGFRIIKN